jgi:hypothetical protein
MGLQSYFDNFASQPSRWSDPDAARCGCRGSGWWNSELDTWHACPAHNIEVKGRRPPHPEHDEYDDGFDHDLHRWLNARSAYRYYRSTPARPTATTVMRPWPTPRAWTR